MVDSYDVDARIVPPGEDAGPRDRGLMDPHGEPQPVATEGPAVSNRVVAAADAPAAALPEWLTARPPSKVTRLPERRVRRAAELGYLTSFTPLPGLGGMTKYLRSSCEALARTLVRPATVAVPAVAAPAEEVASDT